MFVWKHTEIKQTKQKKNEKKTHKKTRDFTCSAICWRHISWFICLSDRGRCNYFCQSFNFFLCSGFVKYVQCMHMILCKHCAKCNKNKIQKKKKQKLFTWSWCRSGHRKLFFIFYVFFCMVRVCLFIFVCWFVLRCFERKHWHSCLLISPFGLWKQKKHTHKKKKIKIPIISTKHVLIVVFVIG